MTMGTILVHLEEHAGLQSVLAPRCSPRRRFGAYISGLHVRPGMPRLVPVAPEGAFIPATEIVEDLERADRELSRRLRETFDGFMREHEVAVGRGLLAGDRPVADWQEEVSPGTEVLGSIGRVFDLIVVGRPVAGTAGALDERARDRAVRERPAGPDRAAGRARRRSAGTRWRWPSWKKCSSGSAPPQSRSIASAIAPTASCLAMAPRPRRRTTAERGRGSFPIQAAIGCGQ